MGTQKGQNVEYLLLDFCKQLLCVKRTTCSSEVYTELGRYALCTYRKYDIKYWKYVFDSDNCIIVAFYKIMYVNCKIFGYKNSVFFVKKYLSEFLFQNWDSLFINKSSFIIMYKITNF